MYMDFSWAKTWGGPTDDKAMGVAALGDNAAVTGRFTGWVDFDPGPGNSSKVSNGSGDVFLSSFSTGLVFDWVAALGGSAGEDCGYGLATDDFGNSFVTGSFEGTVDFDPNGGTFTRDSHAMSDVFINRILNNGLW